MTEKGLAVFTAEIERDRRNRRLFPAHQELLGGGIVPGDQTADSRGESPSMAAPKSRVAAKLASRMTPAPPGAAPANPLLPGQQQRQTSSKQLSNASLRHPALFSI